MKKFTVKPILFMVVLTLIYTTILASINAITVDRIRLNERLSEQTSFLYVLDLLPDTQEASAINSLYEQHVREIDVNGEIIFEGLNDEGEVFAYIVPIVGGAVWGELQGIVALSPDFETVLGIDFLSHSETPGLGGRIDELSFKEQFRDIEIDPEAGSDFLVYRPNPDGQVDAISGATGTSNAVRRIFNDNMAVFMSETREALAND
ncbi:FMN-binding protein [Anoxynatronum buryatiense]|uniref:Na+-transporting NADH:ubiquinone oxidoreductase subunit C n=1 Tax=Anoxynatronum buryatiense TaxID=489973 RepID=A0AA45WT07_9CLOT|nr:FMN-binding protein [Anoxynatronum buryatiense]SMP40192.1 Na+-transporting NADH:ubiquinone oxidoreductase subunit C [Anoxynatronum buryatiense]